MSRMALWLRWSGRDLRARAVQVAAVAAIIALGTGTYAGLSSTSGWRRTSYDQSYRQLRVHDLHVTLAADTYVPADGLGRALGQIPGVDAYRTRLVVPTQVDASRDGRTILVPGRLVGSSLTARPEIDELDVRAGRGLDNTDLDANRVAIDRHFADYYDLPPSGRLVLSGGQTIDYVGQVLSPEYFLIIGTEGTINAQANFAALFADTTTVGRLTGHEGMANDAVIRLPPGTDRRGAAPAVERALRERLPDTAITVTALDDERAYRLMYDDIDGDQRLYNIFAFLVLGGAAFAAFNLVARIVEAQRREIGIGMALGVPPARIAIRPLLVGLEVALLGAAIGIGVGFGVGALMLSVMRDFFPLPAWSARIAPSVYLRGLVIGVTLPFLATLLPVARAVRVDPVDAIRTGPTVIRRTRVTALVAPLATGNSIHRMPFRNVWRAPRRTVLTAFAIAAAIATLIGVLGMVDSFLVTIDRGEAAVIGDAPDRLTVGLSGFAVAGSPELESILHAPGAGPSEPRLQVGGTMSHGAHKVDTLLSLVPFDSSIWRPPLRAGQLDTNHVGVVIGEKAAQDMHVGVGDSITLRHPRREGAGYRMVDSTVPVEGIHRIPYRFITFMDARDASIMDLDGIFNATSIVPAAGTSMATAQRNLFYTPGVASAQPITAFADTIRDVMTRFLDILRLIEGAVLFLAILIAFNSSAINIDERSREHATMFAFGVRLRTVLMNTVVESVLVGLLGTAIGIGLGRVIVGYITGVLLPQTVPDVTVDAAMSATTTLTAVLLGVVAVSLAPLFTIRRLRRMNIPSTLRVVE